MHVVRKQKIADLKMPCVQMPANEQPESMSLPSDLNLTAEGKLKSVRFSSMYQCEDPNLKANKQAISTSAEQFQQHVTSSIATKPDLVQHLDSKEDFWLCSGSSTVIRVHVEPRNQLFIPQQNSCPVSLTALEACRQTKMQSQGFPTSQAVTVEDDWKSTSPHVTPFYWVGTTTFKLKHFPQQSMFPTEEAIRQKQKKANGHVVKPRLKKVEQHYDDCGENLDCLDVAINQPPTKAETEAFSCEQKLMDNISQMFFNPRIQCFGCDADEPRMFWTNGIQLPSMSEVFHARSMLDEPGIDCMELFGGQGLTTYILSKFHGLRTGVNFEMMCGVDLSKQADVQYLFAYIRRNKPKVVLLAPPCRGYSKWGHLNRKINPEAGVESQKLSVPLARLSGDVAIEQLNNQRHFFVEQPHGSGLYQEPPWLKLKDFMYTAVFDQCMTGLRMLKPPFLPVRKSTECKASHPALLMFLQNLKCDGSHEHAHIGSWGSGSRHTVKSSDMQVWPRELCERIAAGVVECLMQMHETNNIQSHFPEAAAEASPDAAPAEPAAECPACKGHMRKTDPRHTRDAKCKFPDVESISWTCPGCVARKNRAHPSHKNDETCQWVIARTMPEGAARERGTTHPRDVRVPASSDPTAGLRMEGREDGVPGASDAAPEILSPLEADARRRAKSERADSSGTRRVSTSVQAEAPRPLAIRRDAVIADDAIVPRPEAPDAPRAEPAADERVSDEVAIPTWSKYDLGFALQQLRSLREGVVRRTLRKLHIRWFHCSAKRMCTLLSAAGVSKEVLMLVPSIIDTCDICRNWQRVGPRTVTSTRVPDTFNLEVQIDLLFYKTNVVLHCVDACTRWTAVEILPNREPESILDGFAKCWIRIFGCPATVLCDQEGGVISDLAAEWFERRGIQVVFRAKEQHCGLVERHNQILRNQRRLLDDQSNAEGLAVPFSTILSESVFAKNALFRCGNASPYEALFGRTPPLLAVVGHETGEALTDRDAARVRHLAIGCMIQSTADQKARTADGTKTRRAGQLLEMRTGDLVEFFRKPVSKDSSGWHGPAQIVDLSSLSDGIVHIKWQGRVVSARVQDIRSALTFATFMMQPSNPIRVFRAEVEAHQGHLMRVGWIKQGRTWVECQGNKEHFALLSAGLYVAACCMHLEGVVGFRFGTNVEQLPAIAFDDTLLLWWNNQKGGLPEWFHCFTPGNRLLHVPTITKMSNVSIVQFLVTDQSEVQSLRQVMPDVPHLGGTHEPDFTNMHDKTEEVLRSSGQKALNDGAMTPMPIGNQDGQPDHQSKPSSSGVANAEAEHLDTNEVQTSEPDLESFNMSVEDAREYNFAFMSVVANDAFHGTAYDSNCLHGIQDVSFLDRQETATFAGTSTRWSQRLLIHVATQMQWELWSADISEAFLRGLTFAELHESGGQLREVQISLPPGGEFLLRDIEGYEDFDPFSEVLVLIKPGFGLRDAPRLWLLALKKVLTRIGVTACQGDQQLFQLRKDGQLSLLMTIHVDDIKMCGRPETMSWVVKQLEEQFDSIKLEKNNFVHLGLQHTLCEDGSMEVSQTHYISELKPIPTDSLKVMPKDQPVDEEFQHLFRSLLGGIAWVTQTRLDIAVYVGALQRKLQGPTVQDVLNANRVLQYLKSKPLVMKFRKLDKPWRLIAISDSGFKGEDQDHLAIRSGLICLVDRDFPKLGRNGLQIIEYVSKKQTRVCRSTYAAELYSALDLAGLLFNISLTLTEVLEGPCTACALADKYESGNLALEADLIIDAASVFDHTATAEPRAPHDATMTIHSLKLRELLETGKLTRLLWCDTRSMLADGLNKGSIDRAALQLAISDACWHIGQEMRVHQITKKVPDGTKQMPEQSSRNEQPESRGAGHIHALPDI
eukprot:s730_g14.t1